jgi:hypothetical protein
MATARRSGARARPLWALAALFGLGTLGFVVWFTRHLPTASCTGPLPPGVTALGAYQMARTPAEIEAVFGPAGALCRVLMVAALDRANRVDLFGFIPTYGAFLAFFLLAMIRLGEAAARVGLVALVAGLGFDVLETATQLRLTQELPGSEAALTALAIGSVGKFAALALAALCAGFAMIARGGVASRIAGILCVAGAALAAVGLVDASARGLLGLGNGIAWLVMLVYAIVAVIRRASPESALPEVR